MARARDRIRWSLRKARPVLRRPLVWTRHRFIGAHDVILGHYPKSGSTWFAFMLGEILFHQPIDFESERHLLPPVGRQWRAPRILPGQGRLLRTYEPHRPEYGRAIYLVRHIGDVAISYYNYVRWLGIEISFNEFLTLFFRGEVDGYGPWPSHVMSWLEAADPTRLLVVRYEDLKADPEDALVRVIKFLHLRADRDGIRHVVEANTIDRMRQKEDRARETVSIFKHADRSRRFVRKGAVGEFRDWLSEDDLAMIKEHAGEVLERLGYGLVQ